MSRGDDDSHDQYPDFPHKSAIDQFFDETQFEAYRALGFHIGNNLFADTHTLGQFAVLMDDSINTPNLVKAMVTNQHLIYGVI